MFRFPTGQELKQLQMFKKPFCLTIYAPYIDPNTTENPARIEMKNLLRDAEVALVSAGVKEKDASKTLRPIREYMEKSEIRATRHEGLVFFSHLKFFAHFHMPDYATPRTLTVGTGFNLDPLLEIMQGNQQYFVLALAHKNVQLYRGDHFELKLVRLKNFPTDMKDALGIDEYPRSIETHSIAPASTGKGSEAQHEQYDVSQTDKNMLLNYFRQIDRRLHRFLVYHQKPLIIAGVDYLLPIYRKANTYPGLLDISITGNQEHVDPQHIREKAWRLIEKAAA